MEGIRFMGEGLIMVYGHDHGVSLMFGHRIKGN